MQFIKANRDAILKPLQTVAGIVERRHTLPILANVLLRKTGEDVSFLATDVEIQIQTTAQLGAGKEDGGTTVSARKLIDILRSLPDGADVSIKVENRRATIQAGRSRFALQTLAAEEYPTVAVNEQFGASFSLPQRQLKHLFQMVHFAMAQQDIRYYLNGLLLVTDGSQVRVVATDGHRLAFCEASIEGDSDDPVQIDVSGNQVRFRFGEVQMVSKLVEGKFPDYHRVIPQGYTKRATVARDVLAAALARASILTSDKFKGVRLSLSPGLMKIQTSNAEQEEAVEEIEVDYAGDALEIGFNVGYLQDVLGNLKDESVRIDFGDANTSALLTVPADESFKYVVMPMRI